MSTVIINGIEYVPAKTVTGTRAAAEPVDVRHLDRSFRFDPDAQQHIPTLLVEFEPVSAVGGGDPKAKGWRDRDLLAMMLRGQPTAHIAPAEQPQPSAPSGWIACDERMPDAGVEVLVWLAAPAFKGSSNVAMDTWGEQHEAPVSWSSATIPVGMGWDSGTDWERITHWMPLPGAPGDAAPAPAAEALHDPRRSSETGTAKATHGPSAEQPASNRRDAAGSVAAGGDGGVPAAEAGPVAWAIRDAIDGAIIDVVMPDDDMLDELSPQHKTPLFAAPPPSAPERETKP